MPSLLIRIRSNLTQKLCFLYRYRYADRACLNECERFGDLNENHMGHSKTAILIIPINENSIRMGKLGCYFKTVVFVFLVSLNKRLKYSSLMEHKPNFSRTSGS